MSHNYYSYLFPQRALSAGAILDYLDEEMRQAKAQPEAFVFADLKKKTMPLKPGKKITDQLKAEPGLITYNYYKNYINFWLHSFDGNDNVVILCISILEGALSIRSPAFNDSFLNLIDQLHIDLKSYRTLMGWELGETIEFEATAELKRLKRAEIRETYWLDIVSQDLVTDELYNQRNNLAQKTPSVDIRKLTNGDLRLQFPFHILAGF